MRLWRLLYRLTRLASRWSLRSLPGKISSFSVYLRVRIGRNKR